MKISMILTSLIVAMSAMSLTACDYAANPEQKTSDMMEKAEEMKDEATDAVQPTPPPE